MTTRKMSTRVVTSVTCDAWHDECNYTKVGRVSNEVARVRWKGSSAVGTSAARLPTLQRPSQDQPLLLPLIVSLLPSGRCSFI